MKPIGTHNYYVYILTNLHKRVLYTGVTNNIERRLYEHEQGIDIKGIAFTARYKCRYLLYYERFQYVDHAISREKEIKGWMRARKVELINEFNPELKFLNGDFE